ncbi:MAG: DUF3551 domain-containing protein [Pseudolabrys sp.]
MKTLTTLTAVAALVAGMSVAGAQNMPSNPPENSSPNQINKGSLPDKNSGTQSQRGAKAPGRSGPSITGNGRFCLDATPGASTLDCKYQSMAACQEAAKPNFKNCVQNPRTSTTGSR